MNFVTKSLTDSGLCSKSEGRDTVLYKAHLNYTQKQKDLLTIFGKIVFLAQTS